MCLRLFSGFMLSNIGMTSGVSGLWFVYCFIVLFKKVILSPLDLVLTVSITGWDPVSRAVELDVCGIQGETTLNLPLFRAALSENHRQFQEQEAKLSPVALMPRFSTQYIQSLHNQVPLSSKASEHDHDTPYKRF